ncbi:MAG: flagellar export protein FliJ [Phycisphaerales bacterium]
MARFVFALQPLLEQRERAEGEAQRAVAEIERERRALEERLRAVQGHLSRGRSDVRSALGAGVVSIGDVRLQAQAGIGWEGEARRIVVELAGVARRLERARGVLREASTARRSLELLRDRRRSEWERERRRAEAAASDELVTIRAARSLRVDGDGGVPDSSGMF